MTQISRGRKHGASIARTPISPSFADAALLVAWAALLADAVRQTRRRGAAATVRWSPSVLAGLAAAAVALSGAVVLERLTLPFTFRPLLAAVGVLLLMAAVALHGWARRTLGARWSPGVAVPHAVIAHGPYAVVRHPIYLAGVLLAAGTLLTHPSPATASIAIGLSAGVLAKTWREDRELRAALGKEYARYAAQVPALVPRPGMLLRALMG